MTRAIEESSIEVALQDNLPNRTNATQMAKQIETIVERSIKEEREKKGNNQQRNGKQQRET